MNLKHKMETRVPKAILKLLKAIGKMADGMGFGAFVVGGFVRDLVLGMENFDLDIVTEGDAMRSAALFSKVYNGRLVSHRKFGTATVYIERPVGVKRSIQEGSFFRLDFATARKEKYERPAQLPLIESSSIREDLYRRDFTINAMAVFLSERNFGSLIDFYNGLDHVRDKRIRVLHDRSFIDDPTRIFRAIRFEQRFNFRIDPYTERLIVEALQGGVLKKTENQRIRDELLLILGEPYPLRSVKRMREFHLLSFLHKAITIDDGIEDLFGSCRDNLQELSSVPMSIRLVDRYLVYLLVMTDALNLRQSMAFCEKFALPRKDRLRLGSYKKHGKKVKDVLDADIDIRPSRVYGMLKDISIEEMILILSKCKSAKAKRAIKDHLIKYINVKIEVNGTDLKTIGISEGPSYRRILDKLLDMKLDGRIKNKKDEIDILQSLL